MSQCKVIALRGFVHGVNVRRNQVIMLPSDVARQLAQRGLVEIIRAEEEHKKKESSSASQADQASPKKTVMSSRSGESKRQKAE